MKKAGQKVSLGTLFLLGILLVILIATVVMAVSIWTSSTAVMNKHGWIALGLGTFFSFAIGGALMALAFHSSRSGHDEAADPLRKRDSDRD